MKTYLCPECGREIEKGETCPECGEVGVAQDLLADDMARQAAQARLKEKHGSCWKLFK